jgi:hypothetical protein
VVRFGYKQTVSLLNVDFGYKTSYFMFTLMKSLLVTYKGWLIAITLGVALSVLFSYPATRQISQAYLQDLIKRQEVAAIRIVKSRFSVQGQYTAEITLTPAAMKRYKQHGVVFASSKKSPHFMTVAGSSTEEVKKWKIDLSNGAATPFGAVTTD